MSTFDDVKLDALPHGSNPFKAWMRGKWRIHVPETLSALDSQFSTVLQLESSASTLPAVRTPCHTAARIKFYSELEQLWQNGPICWCLYVSQSVCLCVWPLTLITKDVASAVLWGRGEHSRSLTNWNPFPSWCGFWNSVNCLYCAFMPKCLELLSRN